MEKPKRPYYVTPPHLLSYTESIEYDLEWAKWVIMHHLLGYAMRSSRELQKAYNILNRDEGSDATSE